MIADTVDTLVLEFGDSTFVTLASDVVVCELDALGVAAHNLDTLLGATGAAVATATCVRVATTDGFVTFVSTARPRFATSTAAKFFRVPRLVARCSADWVRGIHVDAENIAVWIDLPRLARALDRFTVEPSPESLGGAA